MKSFTIRKLKDHLHKECKGLVPSSPRSAMPTKKDPSQDGAALKIQEVWRKYKFRKHFLKNSYATYLNMHDVHRDKNLSAVMFGRTLSAHTKNAPKFLPRNPNSIQGSIYYRTDSVGLIQGDLKRTLLAYEKKPDHKSYNYIPVILSAMVSVEDVINLYAPEFKDSLTILKKEGEQLGFIKIKKNDEYFFALKKILSSLGLIAPNFTGKVARLGVKASPWQLAIAAENQAGESKEEQKIEDANFSQVNKHLPRNLGDLRNGNLKILQSIGASRKAPTYNLALCLYNLISGIPDNVFLSKAQLKRISFLVDLAVSYECDYDRFSFAIYCIIHEIILLLSKRDLKVDFASFKEEAVENALPSFGIDNPEDNSAYRYIALPATSGTNGITLAFSLAKEACKGENVVVKEEGNIYFEYAGLSGFTLKKMTATDSTYDIYFMTSGPTVDSGIHPGTDINKLIRSIIGKNKDPKPMTIIIDSTSGLYSDLKIDNDLQHYITSGKISILVQESHQKFGLAHSDQTQYGRVFGIGCVAKYTDGLIAQFEKNAQEDLRSNVDMQLGAYINIHCGKILEHIKKRHFKNGKYLRGFFDNLGLKQFPLILDKNSLDTNNGLFVYGNKLSPVGRIVDDHVEFRVGFAHFNTTWSDVGPYYRISPSGSDKIDIMIDGAVLYFAAHYKLKQLSGILNEMMNELTGIPSLEEQIMLAALLQTLKNLNYRPTLEKNYKVWRASLKYMQNSCDKMRGRKYFHELLDYHENEQELMGEKDRLFAFVKKEKVEKLYENLNKKQIIVLREHEVVRDQAVKLIGSIKDEPDPASLNTKDVDAYFLQFQHLIPKIKELEKKLQAAEESVASSHLVAADEETAEKLLEFFYTNTIQAGRTLEQNLILKGRAVFASNLSRLEAKAEQLQKTIETLTSANCQLLANELEVAKESLRDTLTELANNIANQESECARYLDAIEQDKQDSYDKMHDLNTKISDTEGEIKLHAHRIVFQQMAASVENNILRIQQLEAHINSLHEKILTYNNKFKTSLNNIEQMKTRLQLNKTVLISHKNELKNYTAILVTDITKLSIPQTVRPFYKRLDVMRKYGETLKKSGSYKGDVIINLANQLIVKANTYFCHNKQDLKAFNKFKKEFYKILHSQDKLMATHRAIWKVILANIAIALSGIGTLILIGQLVHSKISTNKCSFFFEKTISESNREKVEELYQQLSAGAA